MKISILSGTAAWGGAEVHTFGLAETLAARGHEVAVVALGHDVFQGRANGNGQHARFQVRKVALPREVRELSFGECSALLAGIGGDVCVLAKWGLEVGSFRLDLAARRRFGRYIVIEHSSAELPPRTSRRYLGGLLPGVGLWWYRQFLLWHLRALAASLMVCVSEATRSRLVHRYRVPRDKVITIHNGIDPETFRPDPAARRARRQAWNVPEDALVFGAVGRLSPEKGYDLAVDLFARLAARHPDRPLRLVLVGRGAEQTALEEAARKAGVADRVVFPGFCDRPWEAYAALDFFLLPSRDEALPLALLEAMAGGCCPIAMNVGGVGEILTDPALGWKVPAGNAAGFLAALEAAVRMSAQERQQMARAARQHVVAHFNARRQYAALADVIESR